MAAPLAAAALEGALAFDAANVAAAVVDGQGEAVLIGEVDHRFALASVTKLFSAYAVLVALEERSLSLEDPAGPPGSTVAHLLAHASGLSAEGSQPPVAPGTRRIYSNAGFEVLAGTLEASTGIAFSEYLSAAVFDPLHMDAAALVGSPAHGAVATVSDLVNFAAELVSPRLIDPATLGLATSVAFPGLAGVVPGFGRYDPCDWGLGFELCDEKSPHWSGERRAPESFGHFGQSGTFVLVDPVLALAIVLLTDRAFGPWAKQAWPVLIDAVLYEAAPSGTHRRRVETE